MVIVVHDHDRSAPVELDTLRKIFGMHDEVIVSRLREKGGELFHRPVPYDGHLPPQNGAETDDGSDVVAVTKKQQPDGWLDTFVEDLHRVALVFYPADRRRSPRQCTERIRGH